MDVTVRFNKPQNSGSCLIHMVRVKSQVDEKASMLHALKHTNIKSSTFLRNAFLIIIQWGGWMNSIHSTKVVVSRLGYNSFKTKYDWRVENQLPKRERKYVSWMVGRAVIQRKYVIWSFWHFCSIKHIPTWEKWGWFYVFIMVSVTLKWPRQWLHFAYNH